MALSMQERLMGEQMRNSSPTSVFCKPLPTSIKPASVRDRSRRRTDTKSWPKGPRLWSDFLFHSRAIFRAQQTMSSAHISSRWRTVSTCLPPFKTDAL